MKKFVELSTIAACMAALVFAAGCGDSGDQQQAASSDGAPAAMLIIATALVPVIVLSRSLMADKAA